MNARPSQHIHIHALFVELFAWAMLSVFVDLPLRMKFLRPVIRERSMQQRGGKKFKARSNILL